MPPIRPEDHAYRFRPSMLRELREQLKLTQAQMADLLEIPVNTLSRWELGNNLPDANALAAIYSVAAGRGVKPQFFEERRSAMSKFKRRETRIIDWDFQNLALKDEYIEETCGELNGYLNAMCGSPSRLGQYAYVPAWDGHLWGVEHSPQGKELQKAGFKLFSCNVNADQKIIEDGKRVLGSPSNFRPEETAYILISDDGDYAEYLGGIQSWGYETFVFGTDECSQKLIKAVGKDHFIPLNRPYVVLACLKVVRDLKGRPTTKAEFGHLCRKAFSGDGWDEFPSDTGFGKKHPYARIRDYLESSGLVKVNKVGNDPNRITITEVKR